VQRVARPGRIHRRQLGLDRRPGATRRGNARRPTCNRAWSTNSPELQGVAGRYYAAVEGEPVEVANAIDEAYMPRFGGDDVAPSPLGQVLAIAERLDTARRRFRRGLKPPATRTPSRCAAMRWGWRAR
jgi:glycyl-tRNA synthetase beta chain